MKNTILTLALIALAAPALAETKLGYVDVQRAVQSVSSGKKAKESMEAEFKKRKDSLDKKKNDIEKMGQDLEKKKSVLSEEVFGKKQMELQEEMMKFQKIVAENQMEIQKKEKELLEPIFDKMKKVIEKVAQEKSYTMVIERNAQNVLYALKDTDLTDDVIKAFEKEK
jgi:outer membrane protein